MAKKKAAPKKATVKQVHTPGPWKVIPPGHGHKTEWQYGADESYTSLETRPADAHLIAAAPELLDALVSILASYDANDTAGIREEIERSRSAIAKARGE